MKKRVTMVGPFGFEPKKTMRARAFRLARALVQRGHQVSMVMPPWHTPEQGKKQWTEDGVEIFYVDVTGSKAKIISRLQWQVLATQPDVVHCFKPKAYSGVIAEWLWRIHRHNVRVVMDTDDWEGWGGWNEREQYPHIWKHLFAQQERWGMRHCHALTVASRALETLAWGQGIDPAKVIYMPNGWGIDLPSQPPTPITPHRPTILLYSRFFEFEISRLVAILHHVARQIHQLRILLVGSSLAAEDGRQFRQQMQDKGLSSLVEDVGWLPENEVARVISSADVGLYLMDDNLLNRTKCPVKLADMVAVGLPIVGEAVGQVTEYVQNGYNGLLRGSGDVDGVSADLLTLLTHPEQRATLGRHSLQHRQRFAWSNAAQSAERSYQTLT